MRCLLAAFLLVVLVANANWGQEIDRARQAKRIAELEKEIKELETRLAKLNAEHRKLKEAAEPQFKDEYMKSADSKSLRGKWQAVRIAWWDHVVAAESLGKIQLEISEHGFYLKGDRVKWLEPGKKAYEAELLEMNGIWRIDPTTDPKAISFYREPENLAEFFPIYGTYKLEGDMLIVSLGNYDGVYKRLKVEKKRPGK